MEQATIDSYIAISACLQDICVKYNGGCNNYLKIDNNKKIILICPEVYGKLSTPRNPVEIIGQVKEHENSFLKLLNKEIKVMDQQGNDRSKNFLDGALKTLDILEKYNVEKVYLKAKSPSCGLNYIYDGTFSKTLIKGQGIFASLLQLKGYNTIEIE